MRVPLGELKPPLRRFARRFDADRDGLLAESELLVADATGKRVLGTRRAWDSFARDPGRELLALIDARRAAAPSSAQERLTPGQRAVLARVEQEAKGLAQQARPALEQRFAELGHTPAELKRVVAFLRQRAPITINFQPRSFTRSGEPVPEALLRTGAYFNAFEIGISGSPASLGKDERLTAWEARTYRGLFEALKLPKGDRPKFAALNLTRCPGGGARAFGPCYFVLSNQLRDRSLLLPDDLPYCGSQDVGTFDHLDHVLLSIAEDPKQVQALVEVAHDPTKELRRFGRWQEVHLFGPVDFGRDVEAVVLHQSVSGTPAERTLLELAQRYGLEVRWTDDSRTWPHTGRSNVRPPTLSGPSGP